LEIDTKKLIKDIKDTANEQGSLLAELKAKYPITDFVSYDEFNLQDRLSILPMKIVEYQEYHIKEKAMLEALEDQRVDIAGQLYEHYRFSANEKLDKYEIKEYYIPRHPSIQSMDKIIRRQRITVEYMEGCLKALDKMSWGIKDFIKTARGAL